MQTISWNEDLRLGIKTVDNNHRRMVGIANEFINAVNQHSRGAVLTGILCRLREQAVQHLTTEERLMAEARYSKRSVRSLENQRFKVILHHLQRHLQATGEATIKDVQVLKKSLLKHIQGSKRVIIKSMFAR